MSFYKKLTVYFVSLFVVFSVTITLYQYRRERNYRIHSLNLMLQTETRITRDYILTLGDSLEKIETLIEPIEKHGSRITIITTNGTVVYDNAVDSISHLNTHINRPEIIQAKTKGSGYDIRKSESTGITYYYYAERFDDCYIRTALPYNIEVANILRGDNAYIYFMAILFLAMMGLTLQITRKTNKTIVSLRDFALQTQNSDSVDTNTTFPDDEFGEIGQLITQNYKQLKKTKKALASEKDKLLRHLQSSHEGLSIFSNKGEEIVANQLFIQYANTIADLPITSSGQILEQTEFMPINEYLKNPTDDRFRFHIDKGGRIFAVQCMLFNDASFEISIIENTQQYREQEMKRQLTQNISHELKTPVASVRGYLETILETPNISEEKKLQFINRAYSQTQRLTNLIQDISLLNKIDSQHPVFTREQVNIREMVDGVLTDLALPLEQNKMTAKVDIDPNLVLTADASLIYSIFRNLTDNAIAYAGVGTTIYISCYRTDDKTAYFSFRDNGKGIPSEHLDRIFNRFYRVDEGRSRQNGGTGLGLAIVKNAVLMHHGNITARNNQQGGLEFLFSMEL